MNIEYKRSTPAPSSSHVSSRKDRHSASECSDSKEPAPCSISPLLLLRLLPTLLSPSSYSFPLLRVPVVSASPLLKPPIPSTLFSYVWHLTEECSLPWPCRAADIFFGSRMSRQYDIIISKHFRVSRLPIEFLKPLSGIRFRGCIKDDIAFPSILMRTFRAPLPEFSV